MLYFGTGKTDYKDASNWAEKTLTETMPKLCRGVLYIGWLLPYSSVSEHPILVLSPVPLFSPSTHRINSDQTLRLNQIDDRRSIHPILDMNQDSRFSPDMSEEMRRQRWTEQ
jgi:hypothetical protein